MTHNENGTKNKPHLVAVFYGKGCPGENPKFYLNVDGIIRGASVRRLNADRQVILACGRQYSPNGMCEARSKLRLRDAYNMTIKTDKKIILNVNSPEIRDINNYEVVEFESPEHKCTQFVHYLDIKRVAMGQLTLKDFLKEYRAKPANRQKNSNNNALFAAHMCQDLPTLLPYSDLAEQEMTITEEEDVDEPQVDPPKFERCQSVIVANPKQEAFKDSPGTSSFQPF
ncbi:Oidioi.mRNA.OKI2018_I69.XSR.g14026.t1.cds [Oikopleura dioica]|uniref:Oidioi.mRNA.OKI2018_I69.XSR.g14026.t1.cds n=1 Tax=Oikopleura dioica TaxID=34765 RepID=A0ABN7S8L9_OIKDI|nr:Oidioi.mRNA.OKI2018_I69.XSR.g14026.t1.cds [Oikopleura dioica]